MTSGTPTSKPEQQPPAVAAPVGPKPWWHRWFEPTVMDNKLDRVLEALLVPQP